MSSSKWVLLLFSLTASSAWSTTCGWEDFSNEKIYKVDKNKIIGLELSIDTLRASDGSSCLVQKDTSEWAYNTISCHGKQFHTFFFRKLFSDSIEVLGIANQDSLIFRFSQEQTKIYQADCGPIGAIQAVGIILPILILCGIVVWAIY